MWGISSQPWATLALHNCRSPLQHQGQELGHEEIRHIQGQRNPSKRVGTERGHQRAERQKPQSQKINQSNHMDHSFV